MNALSIALVPALTLGLAASPARAATVFATDPAPAGQPTAQTMPAR